MVSALASHQCGPGSIARQFCITCGFFLFVLYSAPRDFSPPGTLIFHSPSPLASSTSSLVVLASYCPSLRTPTLFSEHAHHPSSTYARTISLHLPLPSEPLFPSIPTSPSGPLSSFSPSVLHHTLLSPLLSQSLSKLLSHFPSDTMSNSHITSPLLHNSDKPFLSKYC